MLITRDYNFALNLQVDFSIIINVVLIRTSTLLIVSSIRYVWHRHDKHHMRRVLCAQLQSANGPRLSGVDISTRWERQCGRATLKRPESDRDRLQSRAALGKSHAPRQHPHAQHSSHWRRVVRHRVGARPLLGLL